MDYTKLRDLLKAGKWKEADEETRRVMLAVAKLELWFNPESIDNFPCADLRTIDKLWIKYSDGRFGFSVQKRIYQGLGGMREWNYKIWEEFEDKVGWSKFEEGWRKKIGWFDYKDIAFDKKPPEGHLPAGGLWVGVGANWSDFLSRVETCRF